MRRGPFVAALVAALAATATAACGDSSGGDGDTANGAPIAGAHDCVPPGEAGDVTIAWDQLANPVVDLDHMTKDETVRFVDGQWHMYFSERFESGGDPATRTGHWVSDDLSEWSPAPAVPEWGSPDITSAEDGTLVITAQVRDPDDPEVSRIEVSTSDDPDGPWSEPRELLPDELPGERTIDAALAHTDLGLFLLFKRGLHTSADQHVELAWSESGALDGPWEVLGEPDLPLSENFEFLPIDGTWHVLATSIPVHEPVLYELGGDPGDERSWLHWEKVRAFDVPEESWNTGPGLAGVDHETANSAYLCDARGVDGSWYLFYAGSTELTTFEGRGHAKIGLARSKDLEHWDVPPG